MLNAATKLTSCRFDGISYFVIQSVADLYSVNVLVLSFVLSNLIAKDVYWYTWNIIRANGKKLPIVLFYSMGNRISANSTLPYPPPNWPPISTSTNSPFDHTSLGDSQHRQEEQLAGTTLLEYSMKISYIVLYIIGYWYLGPSSGSIESTWTRGPTLLDLLVEIKVN